ncbi:glycosyltransferase [Rhizobium sp. P44RR-XXIV]|uniref:glycosyltransferase n=1 Tax=Rhizobium sp. P44RR-XXIV TaxID=1921145 RepID=UPI000984778F|nr:glycosyltransferase [Rhizobium sp. P44RR-XXIV]TIX86662.1 glycosyltransferase family 2 protein [Rhizobium sp. P44RR-XXIV]
MNDTPGECSSISDSRRICIGTITRGRPVMLRALLASYAEMYIPPNTHLHFIIVENNDIPTLQDVIDEFGKRLPQCTIQYEIEPRLGIAFARNHVLEAALSANGHLLTFADDDEVVSKDWLIELLAERDASHLDILGSPVRFASPSPDISMWRKMVWSGMNKVNRSGEAKALRNHSIGKSHCIRIATGSWMANLTFFRNTGLRFDNSLGLSGGEDWQLWLQAKRLGAKTGWAPRAIVFETVPIERLTLRYQYLRSRDHSTNLISKKLKAKPAIVAVHLAGSIAGRILRLSFYVVAAPFTRGNSLVRAASCLGSMAGLVQACLGRTSAHYDRIHGS